MQNFYVDVHTHLTHEKFSTDLSEVIKRAEAANVLRIVVNGLDKTSNREILKLSERFACIRAALGIYPVHAVHPQLPEDFPYAVSAFDIAEEIAFIASQAAAKNIIAIGETGLDGHILPEDLQPQQEHVFCQLIDIAKTYDLPIIVHTRKLEKRSIEILQHMQAPKVDFHCFGGKTKLAQQIAENHGWHFSIPANAERSESFRKMLRTLPPTSILTETDAPYLAPLKGERNEPSNVVATVNLLAKLRGWSLDQARKQVATNYHVLFQD